MKLRAAAAAVVLVVLLGGTAACSAPSLATVGDGSDDAWAAACTAARTLTTPDLAPADRSRAVDRLTRLVQEDGRGGTFDVVVGPVADGARRGDLGPARVYEALRC
ncbi:hypothetical protein SAMN06264364_11562 [Quadrisphaera granulorum]|uniref:Lipoprotein n=1 Tax=Quadrisphaera granulorum TaxID=317664 RepID=A0A316A5T2_9ACTN|nr:hypothetical protein [Quadrisphaera granulorum]PWJ53045.1 hypothetical protein BXY45_11562 [Quadrisphaera granulorum]SZE97210.1 hypothetical protein SAMN06264364_11562 [Quadrisphaera granulorum]